MPKFWTDQQVIDAINEHDGNVARAAADLGANPKALRVRWKRLKAGLARQGYSPEHDMVHTVPDGFHVRGVSTLYDGETGEQKLQWVKSGIDADRQRELIREAAQAMAEELPRERPRAAPAGTEAVLANLFIVTDYHLGMMSWHRETGADWDTRIAEDLLVRWFASALAGAPDARVGVLAQLGDFLHWDGLDAVTPTSGNILDADTRFTKLVRVAIRVLRRVIGMMLAKHETVHVIMAEGNHDLASSVWLREWLAAIYEDEPRITVDTNADPYYCYEHGATSLFFHHGHKTKPQAVDEVFAAKFREVFGRTRHSYAHMGHQHHRLAKETSLMLVEQHRTLAAPDAHASRGGYSAGRDAAVITYHSVYGEVGRITRSPDMVSGG